MDTIVALDTDTVVDIPYTVPVCCAYSTALQRYRPDYSRYNSPADLDNVRDVVRVLPVQPAQVVFRGAVLMVVVPVWTLVVAVQLIVLHP